MDDLDKTMAPQRTPAAAPGDDVTMPGRRILEPIAEPADIDATMPGRRDRKPDGRFDIGDLIMNRYKVLAKLGQGGMGVVYRCLDETAGVEVALKALPPELSHNTLEMEDIRDNFKIVHDLHHPNIASYNTLELDPANGNYYLIMECCEGEDLRRWIKRKRKADNLTLADVLPIVQQVAAALDYAHSRKVIHRDIKPGNIMINADGEIKVLDFGLAAQIHTSMTRVSMAYHGTSGTGPYMAPEQWDGRQQNARADQYALAVMTYEMLAGYLPFESPDAAVLREAVLKSKVIPLKNIPAAANIAIQRAMSKEPADRFESCSEFAAALASQKAVGGKVRPTGKIIKWAALTIAAALLIGGAIFIAGNNKGNSGDGTGGVGGIGDGTGRGIGGTGGIGDGTGRGIGGTGGIGDGTGRGIGGNGGIGNGTGRGIGGTGGIGDGTGSITSKDPVQTFTLSNNVKLEMVLVEPDSFKMSKKDGENYSDEVEHPKTLTKPFYIGKYEVTQAQWKSLMGTDVHQQKAKGNSWGSVTGVGGNHPMYFVSWHEAMEFCEKMNKYAPEGWRFTLPTETQWEYAARGGNKSRSYKYSGSDTLGDVAWYDGNSGGTTHEVGGKGPNELGLYDMSGNVREWCLDNWTDNSSKTTPEFTRAYRDSDGSYRVIRGGSWGSNAQYCRSAARFSSFPAVRYCDLGFRLALVPVQ